MNHIITEIVLEKPFERLAETVSGTTAPQRMRARQHASINFLLNGSHLISGPEWGTQTFQGGDILILPEGATLKKERDPSRNEKRSHLFSIYFQPEKNGSCDPFEQYVRPYLSTIHFLAHAQTHSMRALVAEIRQEAQDLMSGAAFKLNALVRSLAVDVVRQLDQDHATRRPSTRSRAYITNQAKEYIAKNHTQSIRLSDIAWHLNLSEEHLCRIFKMETGMTLFAFLNWFRVEYSKEALMQSNRTVSQIAEMAGFSSSTLFSRQFKLHSGMSPMEYRLTHGGRFGSATAIGTKV